MSLWRIRYALGILVVLSGLCAPAVAHFERQPCNGVVQATSTPAGILYTDDRGPNPPSIVGVTGSVWHYLESNGHSGLQGGGSHAIVGEGGDPFFFDPCDTTHGTGERGQPDTLVF